MTHHVVVVEDEPDIAALVAYHLQKAGYRVTTAASGDEGLTIALEQAPDLIVLDLMLPGQSGYEMLQALRRQAATRDIGVVILTARKDEPDRIRGLSLGADDYLVKPFSPRELVLRVRAVLRRLSGRAGHRASRLVAGPLAIDRAAHKVSVAGREVSLTATEYKLLTTLAERAGRVQSRAQLLESVWAAHPEIQTRTVDMHMQRLRAKLGPAAGLLETVRGVGYRFRPPDRAAEQRK